MQMRPGRTATAAALTAAIALAALADPVVATGATGLAGSAGGPPATRAVRLRVTAAADEAPWRSAARAAMLADVQGDRATAGLVAYLRDPALDDIAQARVDRLAANGAFGHLAAGASILEPVEASGLRPYAAGEAQGWASDPSSDAALDRIRALWLASPGHRAIVLADWASYAGIGVATDGGRILVILVVADTPDRTAPSISVDSAVRTGSAVTVRWSADDPRLQARTAGVGSVAVEWRPDGGRWRAARAAKGVATGSGATAITNVPADRAVDVRVRARDRAGNLSPWATARVAILP